MAFPQLIILISAIQILLENENFGKPFLGKSSENILKSETTKSTNLFQLPIIETTSTTNYTYEFDNFGRVATQYITTDALIIKNTFTYY